MRTPKYILVGMIIITLVLSTTSTLGFLIIDNENTEIFMKNTGSCGPVLDVTTDKYEYHLGEPVTIFLTNVGDETLCGGGPIITIYDEDDEVVYEDACYCYWELEPGEYIEWPPWDQTDQQGNQVPVGEYVVEGFLSGHIENYVDTATFFIIDHGPPGLPSGPTEGVVDVEYTFCIKLPDDPECEPYYTMWDWGDGTMSEWFGPYVAGEIVCASHSWDEPGHYEIRVIIRDSCGNEEWSDPLTIYITANSPPNPPAIEGPTGGTAGTSYPYEFVSIDPEGTIIWYYIDWGDGSNTGWIGLYVSGKEITLSHAWSEQGTYTIEAKAKDIYGAESGWGTLEVTMPRNKAINTLFLNFLQQHPNLFPILRYLLGL